MACVSAAAMVERWYAPGQKLHLCMGDSTRFLVKVPHFGTCEILLAELLKPVPLLVGNQSQRLLRIGTRHTGIDISLVASFFAWRDYRNMSADMANACGSISAWLAFGSFWQWTGH